MENVRHVLEELYGLVDGHLQHVGNAFSLEAHFERFAVVAFAVARFAGHEHVGQKVHFDVFVAVALARFAASAAHVEAEAPRFVAPHFGLGQPHEERAYVAEHSRVGGGIGARCASQRTLVDGHHLVDVLHSFESVVGQGLGAGAVEVL